MLDHTKKVARAFDQAAQTYDDYAELQQHAGRKLITLLPSNAYENAIDLGCGTGTITRELINQCQPHHLYAVDTSIMSLAIAHERLNNPNVTINTANFDVSLPSLTPFDLIFANMSLHWSVDFSALLQRLYQHLATNGTLAFSIPLNNTFAEIANHFSVNHFLTVQETYHLLKSCHFNIIASQHESATMEFPDTISTLRYIKRIGAHHVSSRKHAGLMGKNLIQSFDISTLTYQLGYFIVSKTNES